MFCVISICDNCTLPLHTPELVMDAQTHQGNMQDALPAATTNLPSIPASQLHRSKTQLPTLQKTDRYTGLSIFKVQSRVKAHFSDHP